MKTKHTKGEVIKNGEHTRVHHVGVKRPDESKKRMARAARDRDHAIRKLFKAVSAAIRKAEGEVKGGKAIMKHEYIVNSTLDMKRSEDRDADYQAIQEITSKWKPIKDSEGEGSFASQLIYDPKDRKFSLVPETRDGKRDWKRHDALEASGCVPAYQVMPSALWLYRLLCLFKAKVYSPGPEAYKLVWSVSLEHKASGQTFMFYEWKGGFTCGFMNRIPDKKKFKAFEADILELLNLLASDKCLHPYDGVVAGSVA